jgi:hypothetical protein
MIGSVEGSAMMRVLRVCLYLVIAAALLAPVRATAQMTLPGEYTNPQCGFAYRYPQGWDAGLLDGYFLTVAPEVQAVGIVAGIRNLAASPLSPQSAASAAAGAFCLDCMRDPADKLVWWTASRKVDDGQRDRLQNETAVPLVPPGAHEETPGTRCGSSCLKMEPPAASSPRNGPPGKWPSGKRGSLPVRALVHAIVRACKFTAAQQECWR